MVIYGTELLLWIGIFVCGAYYNLIPWMMTRRAKRKSEHDRSDDTGPASAETPVIALHDLPSSTSVFRTPLGDIEAMRQRSISLGRGLGLEHMASRVT
jgi:hypothetical protein